MKKIIEAIRYNAKVYWNTKGVVFFTNPHTKKVGFSIKSRGRTGAKYRQRIAAKSREIQRHLRP